MCLGAAAEVGGCWEQPGLSRYVRPHGMSPSFYDCHVTEDTKLLLLEKQDVLLGHPATLKYPI